MRRRRLWASLLGCVGITALLLILNLAFRNTPVLGLDLQGGVSVVLAPEEGASGDDLIVIRDLIRDELENRGIAEPDVRVEGSNIIVDLPGVKDQRDALDAVDVAGIVTLRPVYTCVAATDDPTASTVPGSSVAGSTPPTIGAPTTVSASTTSVAPSGFANPNATPTTTAPSTTTPPADDTPTTATTPTTSPTTTVAGAPTTTVPVAEPETTVLRQLGGGSCLVGPPAAGGEDVLQRNGASVDLTQQRGWTVAVDFTPSGVDTWSALASQCNTQAATCPSGQLAIVLDDVVQSAPVVNAEAVFTDSVAISGNFEEGEARSLARVLNRGAFPTDVEVRRVDTVSPTLGEDSLRASIVAGLIGVAVLLVFLILFYRRLTLLLAAGMIVWGMLIYSVSILISEQTNYALTLAGVTGIVVSIGMTVDSYVVYFERMKDEVLHGRTFKNSAARSFKSTWRTILAANLVSFIAAAVLFVMSVGSVRGFALYLGVTTVCDVVVLWFFTRPAVILMADTGRLDRHDPFGIGAAP